MTYKVYAPNVHLFAFHLRDDFSSDNKYDNKLLWNKLLWNKCQEIFEKFEISQELKIRDVAPGSRVDLLEEATNTNILLSLEGTIILDPRQKTRVTGIACPLQTYDSYALALNLRIDELDQAQNKTEVVDIDIFQKFNPDNCFLSTNINSSLGQTLLLTAWLSQAQRQDETLWREIADRCVKNFCGQKTESPQLYQQGILFDSPIFEYGIPNSSNAYEHILIWLFFAEEEGEKYYAKADDNLNLFYQEFIDLFFYRNKVIKVYHLSRDVYKKIHNLYESFKQTVHEIANVSSIENNSLVTNTIRRFSNIELKNYQDKLSILPLLDLQYSEYLTEFDKYRLTIETNTKNYTEKLRQIQEKSSNKDLQFLSSFNQIISIKFSNQIQTDLGYFAHTSGLVDKAITSIRGIVEIEQAERDRSLERTIQVLGVAFGGGAIVSGVVTQHIDKPFAPQINFKYPLHPLVSSLLWSVLVTVIFGMVAWWVTQPKPKRNKQK